MAEMRIISGKINCKNPNSGSVRINFRDATQTHGLEDGSISAKIIVGSFGQPFKNVPSKILSINKFKAKTNSNQGKDNLFQIDSEVKAGFSDISWHTEEGEILEILISFIGQE